MPTTDELQSQINALQSQLNSILGMADDDYIHQYSGEEIDAGITAAGNAVRYDLAQSLTTAQQAQARGNINAAPGGYGLGVNTTRGATSDSSGTGNADTITDTCFFMAKTNSPTGDWCYGICISRSATKKLQIMWSEQGSGSAVYDGCYAERIMKAGTWGPWEWVNPPLAAGVEYRTTERYLGKPVYVKVVDCGLLSDDKKVAHGISNMGTCLSFMGVRAGGPLPQIYNHSLNDVWTSYVSAVNETNISLACGSSSAGANCYVTLKYTKTTD